MNLFKSVLFLTLFIANGVLYSQGNKPNYAPKDDSEKVDAFKEKPEEEEKKTGKKGKDRPFSFRDNLYGYMGGLYQFVNIKEEGEPIGILGIYGLAGGGNLTLLHANDVASLNVSGNLHLGVSLSNRGVSFLGQIPLYLVGRVGAGATPFNNQMVGIGAGIGGNFSYLFESPNSPFNQFFVNPSLLVDLNLNTSGASTYSIRVNAGLLPMNKKLNEGLSVVKTFGFNSFGLSLLYSF